MPSARWEVTRLMRRWTKYALSLLLTLLCLPSLAQLNGDVDKDTTKWFNRTHQIDNVDVRATRGRYSRKGNPAVELMRKVIAARHLTDLSRRDYYQYDKYQKLKLAVNEVTPDGLLDPRVKDRQWLWNQVEVCPYNNKLILPFSVQEKVWQKNYRREPLAERSVIKGVKSAGINDLIQTGEILNTVVNDIFTDVNIYDNQIRLLQHPFTSPIGDGAIAFYRYYIEDTVYVGRDRCFHLSFLPNNQQDFGFRGELFILADSSYQVRRCKMTIPDGSAVNFVSGMQIVQEFSQLPDSSWVLTTDDMFTELRWMSFMESFAVVRHTRLSNYNFGHLSDRLFKDSRSEREEPGARMRNERFWERYRQVALTRSESSMDRFIEGFQQIKGFKYILYGLKALIENFVETTTERPSKVDIGPINTIITSNFIDGLRTRLSAQTTANLDSNLFLSGYVAHGWRSHETYYKGNVTWSLNKKDYLPREFPKRTISFTSTYDVIAPSDKFLDTDKDNVFTSFKWASVEQMMFYNRQQLAFEYETYHGLKTTFDIVTERDAPAGNIDFTPIRTTELHGELRYAPGETYINTKQRRTTVNHDSPVFTLGHTVGIKHLFGGEYNFNLTEAVFFKRFWLGAGWGKVDCRLRGAIQWNQVPFMLLVIPEANLSYILSENTFNLVNNMEFLSDRYASLMVNWDMNGKLFNRIPLLKKLKWREWIAIRGMWGTLSDKNNPLITGDALLQPFPTTSHLLNSREPYWEMSVGIHNIFKLLQIEYTRRLNYNHLPTAHKQGIRFTLRMTF